MRCWTPCGSAGPSRSASSATSATPSSGHPPQPGQLWNWTPAKRAVEWLFWQGEVSAVRNPQTFERSYVTPGAGAAGRASSTRPRPSDGRRHEGAAAAGGPEPRRRHRQDLADYHRLPIVPPAGWWRSWPPTASSRRSTVEGWKHPAYLHPEAQLPRRVRAAGAARRRSTRWCGSATRIERLFDFRYRIEIYTPAPKRVHGYYVMPFLLDDRLVARVDLKADRQVEPTPGAGRLRRTNVGRRQGSRPARRAPHRDGGVP